MKHLESGTTLENNSASMGELVDPTDLYNLSAMARNPIVESP